MNRSFLFCSSAVKSLNCCSRCLISVRVSMQFMFSCIECSKARPLRSPNGNTINLIIIFLCKFHCLPVYRNVNQSQKMFSRTTSHTHIRSPAFHTIPIRFTFCANISNRFINYRHTLIHQNCFTFAGLWPILYRATGGNMTCIR